MHALNNAMPNKKRQKQSIIICKKPTIMIQKSVHNIKSKQCILKKKNKNYKK